ncbi:MAG TPA: alpha/beta hydrolase fold domain-containing protein [Caulobacteraceae bacterium]|nr:alpha/beta hydrolase fold domain-containing protein [Caulobacteraceae bacterium]
MSALPSPPDTLSAEARAYLAAIVPMEAAGAIDLAQTRPITAQIQAMVGAEQRKAYAVTVADDIVAGVPVRRIAPASGSADRSRVLLNLHGGGFATDSGSLTENIPVAALAGLDVIAVLYRFAPEHPFPAAVDDALAVYRTLLAAHDPRDIGVYGTSAGAVIAPQLMMRLKAEGMPLPGVLGVFSGEPDLAGTADSLRIFATAAEARILTDAKWAYVGGADPLDPLLSPIRGDLSGFPPTLCLSSGRDVLLSGTVNLARALTDAGVPTELVVYDALPHAFWSSMLAPESDDAFRRMSSFLTKHLGRR